MENSSQRKCVFWHILSSGKSTIVFFYFSCFFLFFFCILFLLFSILRLLWLVLCSLSFSCSTAVAHPTHYIWRGIKPINKGAINRQKHNIMFFLQVMYKGLFFANSLLADSHASTNSYHYCK